jgi:glycerophosphoryl diester phosphodiesterase
MIDTPMKQRRRFLVSFLFFLLASFITFFVIGSNAFFYISFQRFGRLANFQLDHCSTDGIQHRQIQIIGHRGSAQKSTTPNLVIGNTQRSITSAIKANVNWIEIDVRRTRDGKLVLFHDDSLNKKTFNLEGKAESKSWNELQKGKLKVADIRDQTILSLENTLSHFHALNPNLKWILDVKLDNDQGDTDKQNTVKKATESIQQEAALIKEDVVSILKSVGLPKSHIIIFGDTEVITAFQGTGFQLGYTTILKRHKDFLVSRNRIIQFAKHEQCKLLVIPILFVTHSFVELANEEGVTVWSYDSDDLNDLKYCIACGVEGLIVDHPNQTIPTLRRLLTAI